MLLYGVGVYEAMQCLNVWEFCCHGNSSSSPLFLPRSLMPRTEACQLSHRLTSSCSSSLGSPVQAGTGSRSSCPGSSCYICLEEVLQTSCLSFWAGTFTLEQRSTRRENGVGRSSVFMPHLSGNNAREKFRDTAESCSLFRRIFVCLSICLNHVFSSFPAHVKNEVVYREMLQPPMNRVGLFFSFPEQLVVGNMLGCPKNVCQES